MRKAVAGVAGIAVIAALVVFLLCDEGDGGSSGGEVDAEAVLRRYLGALADGDYDGAAALLVAGGEPLGEREDLVPLSLDGVSVDAVASALAGYCGGGCVRPTSVEVVGREPDGSVRLTAGFGEPRGHPVARQFVVGDGDGGGDDEGIFVRGLPPPDLSPIPG